MSGAVLNIRSRSKEPNPNSLISLRPELLFSNLFDHNGLNGFDNFFNHRFILVKPRANRP